MGWTKMTPTQLTDLNRALNTYQINTPARIAQFMAQTSTESGKGMYTQELASGAAYNGRKDLGNVHAGDGQYFKGGGYI